MIVLQVLGGVLLKLLFMAAFGLVGAGGVLLWRRFFPLKRKPIDPLSAGRIRARMRRMQRPTLLLTPAEAPGFSKLGGEPELPAGLSWLSGMKHAQVFLAQIDLGTFQPHAAFDWLPQEGRLYAFHDPERFGFADVVSILYSREPPGAAVPAPGDLPRKLRFRERRVAFENYVSIPSLDWLGVDLAELSVSDSDLDDLADAPSAAFGDELQHRIGGYPSEIQPDQMHVSCELMVRGLERDWNEPVAPAILRAAREWRLLLQIDSDNALGMNWGDGGRFYVFGRARDLARGNFSKTVTISQTY